MSTTGLGSVPHGVGVLLWAVERESVGQSQRGQGSHSPLGCAPTVDRVPLCPFPPASWVEGQALCMLGEHWTTARAQLWGLTLQVPTPSSAILGTSLGHVAFGLWGSESSSASCGLCQGQCRGADGHRARPWAECPCRPGTWLQPPGRGASLSAVLPHARRPSAGGRERWPHRATAGPQGAVLKESLHLKRS